MIKRKLLSIVLAAVMALTACGSSENGKKEKVTQDRKTAANEDFSAENSYTDYLPITQMGKNKYSDELKSKLLDFTVKTGSQFYEKSEGANYVYSPASLYLGLALCAEITDDGKAADLLDILGAKDREELEKNTKDIIAALSSDGNEKTKYYEYHYISSISNSIWSDNDTIVLSEEGKQRLKRASEQMYADLYSMDIQSDAAYELMNEWVKEKTRGLIETIPKRVDKDTVMALFNTLYFDKSWASTNEVQETEDREFYFEGDETVNVPMMDFQVEDRRYYYESDNALAATLHYCDGSYIILIDPNEGTSLDTVMKNDVEKVITAYANENYSEADRMFITMPRVDYEMTLEEMQDAVKTLGVDTIFNPGTSFEGLVEKDSEYKELFIGKISQKCRIIMNEEGTKAAAVTEMEMKNGSAYMPEAKSITMTLDHPFAYVIMSANNTPLFVGAVQNPAK